MAGLLATRLESLATPGEILISYETYAHIADEIACEALGEVEVKGLAYPVATYHVASARDRSGEVLDLAALTEADPAAMSEVERRTTMARLSNALERLSRACKPAAAE